MPSVTLKKNIMSEEILENQEEENQFQIITLCSEDGKEQDFQILDAFAYEGKNYVVILPWFEKEEDFEKASQEEGFGVDIMIEGEDDYFLPIEDDNEYERIYDYYQNLE